MAVEKKIYSGWAFSENELEKKDMNYKIYQEIKDKAELKLVKIGFAHNTYKVVSNPEDLSTLELALIADNGNLCFGHRLDGERIVIHTD